MSLLSNDNCLADADSPYTLAYAVIMLNTDQHNPNASKQNVPMTNDQVSFLLKQLQLKVPTPWGMGHCPDAAAWIWLRHLATVGFSDHLITGPVLSPRRGAAPPRISKIPPGISILKIIWVKRRKMRKGEYNCHGKDIQCIPLFYASWFFVFFCLNQTLYWDPPEIKKFRNVMRFVLKKKFSP